MSRDGSTSPVGGMGTGAFLLLVVLVVTLLVALVGGVFIGAMDQRQEAEIQPSTVEWTELEATDEVPNRFIVEATTGQGAHFDSSYDQRYIDAELGDGWTNDSWTVALTANLDNETNQQAAYSAFAFDNETIVIQWDDGEWVAYYDLGSEDVSVRVPATTAKESVVVEWDDGANELSIETPDYSDTATPDTNVESRAHAYDWLGMVDEVRVIEQNVTAADTEQYFDDPVAPLPDSEESHVARFMLDEGEGATTEPFYSSTSAQLVGVGWTDGVAGPDLSSGEDYEVRVGPLEIRAVEGGYLDGAPVAFVFWDDWLGFGSAFEMMSNMGTIGLGLFALSLIVIAGVAVAKQLDGLQGIGRNNRR